MVLVATQLLACEARKSSAAAARNLGSGALSVEFAGCAAVYRGPRCELGSEARVLTFWSAADGTIRAKSADGELNFERVEAVDSGRRYRLRVPKGASAVVLYEARTGQRFRLPVADVDTPVVLTRATALRARGEFAEARALLQAEAASLPPAFRGRAGALLARIELSEGHYEAAAAGLAQALHEAEARGAVSDAVYDATALSYVLSVRRRDYAEARRVLGRAVALAAHDPSSRALVPHYEGVLALELGDLRTALSRFREAAARTGRLGLTTHELLARQNEATALALLGRHGEAIELQQRIIAQFPPADACRAVDLREELTWLGILAQLAPGAPAWDAVSASSREAERGLEACRDGWRRRNHLINGGLLALSAGDLQGAREALEAIASLEDHKDIQLRVWEFELGGRVALAEQAPRRALVAFEAARALSQRAGLWDSEQLAELGIGRSLERLGRLAAAAEAYGAADRLLDKLLDGVPFGEGLGGFVHEREAATQALVTLWTRMAQPARALELARRGRARVIRSLARTSWIAAMDASTRARWEEAIAHYRAERAALERAELDSWQLPADRLPVFRAELAERRRALLASFDRARALLSGGAPPERPLSAPSPHEPLFALFSGAGGTLAFLARGDRVHAEALAPGSLAELARAFWARQLGAEAARAVRERRSAVHDAVPILRLVLHGSAAAFDLHALSVEGAPLLEHFAVAYALDAGSAPRSAVHRGALVIADPTSDLPASLREAEAARGALGASSGELLLRGAATRARVLEALGRVAVLHYAGHGQYAGVEGSDSGLRLADGWLSVADILALPSVPELVVLSACEGARAEANGDLGGLGVAEAFVAAGTSAVIAATRPVPDATASVLFQKFYALRSADPQLSAAALLRAAALGLRAEQPTADWSSFRVLVP